MLETGPQVKASNIVLDLIVGVLVVRPLSDFQFPKALSFLDRSS